MTMSQFEAIRIKYLKSIISRIQVILSSETGFCCLIVLGCVLLYTNSLFGTFIWDDRAAVVRIYLIPKLLNPMIFCVLSDALLNMMNGLCA